MASDPTEDQNQLINAPSCHVKEGEGFENDALDRARLWREYKKHCI